MIQIDQPTTVGLIVTGGFLVLGVLSKAIAKSGFGLDDLNLGLETVLAALTTAGIYGLELAEKLKGMAKTNSQFDQLSELRDLNYKWLLALFLGLIGIATVHMVWEKDTVRRIRRFFMLTVFSNLTGFAVLFGYIYFVKRGI